ncbi:uncharacterized protein LOC123797959 [Ursus americanus]|uniref:uncharacterized protein LOC123797959 n=1 Tax=Ursus americanus TaxID=9643 RepID=UPI001E67B40C|nr:uncharacterized protein LOC123797959 [Ursus americanus]
MRICIRYHHPSCHPGSGSAESYKVKFSPLRRRRRNVIFRRELGGRLALKALVTSRGWLKILKLFPLRANKQTDAPGADLNSCRAGVHWDSQTRRKAHPCGARREVPRKQGGSLSELGLWRSRREGIPNRRRLAPLGHFRVKAGGDLSALRPRPRYRELAFWAQRSCGTATLRSPKVFGIQGTLRNLTGQPVCVSHSCRDGPVSPPRASGRVSLSRCLARYYPSLFQVIPLPTATPLKRDQTVALSDFVPLSCNILEENYHLNPVTIL